MLKRGKLVILVGIDGSGKSTLLACLESKGYFTSHWRKLRSLSSSRPLNFENPGEVVQSLNGQERLDFIWAYISSEWEYLISPTRDVSRDVISDGFFIRFFVKEKIYKKLVVDELLRRSPLSGEEFVIMIDIPPEVAFERKKKLKISPYECFRNSKDFVCFQSLQRKALLKFIEEFPHTIVNGMLPKTKLVKDVLLELKEHQIEPR